MEGIDNTCPPAPLGKPPARLFPELLPLVVSVVSVEPCQTALDHRREEGDDLPRRVGLLCFLRPQDLGPRGPEVPHRMLDPEIPEAGEKNPEGGFLPQVRQRQLLWRRGRR